MVVASFAPPIVAVAKGGGSEFSASLMVASRVDGSSHAPYFMCGAFAVVALSSFLIPAITSDGQCVPARGSTTLGLRTLAMRFCARRAAAHRARRAKEASLLPRACRDDLRAEAMSRTRKKRFPHAATWRSHRLGGRTGAAPCLLRCMLVCRDDCYHYRYHPPPLSPLLPRFRMMPLQRAPSLLRFVLRRLRLQVNPPQSNMNEPTHAS